MVMYKKFPNLPRLAWDSEKQWILIPRYSDLVLDEPGL